MNAKAVAQRFWVATMWLLFCGTLLAQEEQPLPSLICQTKDHVWVRHTHTGLDPLAGVAEQRSVFRIDDMWLYEVRENSDHEKAIGKVTQFDSRADYFFRTQSSHADEIIAITLFRDTLHGYVVFTSALQTSISYIECAAKAIEKD